MTLCVRGAVLNNILLAVDRHAETSALAFLDIRPVYRVLEEIQEEASDNDGADNPDGKTKKVKHSDLSFNSFIRDSRFPKSVSIKQRYSHDLSLIVRKKRKEVEETE